MAVDAANYQEAQTIAVRAIEIAIDNHHEMATLEHVLIALLETPDVQTCLTGLNADAIELAMVMNSFLTGSFVGTATQPGPPPRTAAFETLFGRAVATAVFSARKVVTPVDLLLHLAQFPHEDSYAVTALLQANVTPLAIKKFLAHGSRADGHEMAGGLIDAPHVEPVPTTRQDAIAVIRKYAANLNEQVAQGKIDPLIGRARELDQTLQVLARRSKNNCLYVGDAGVGKTALAEGLAYHIVRGTVPALLTNAVVWSLDLGALVAGTRFRGDFEERMKHVLNALILLSEPLPDGDPLAPPLAILFIDEIHMIMEAGAGSRGSMDVGNMLKPALSKGSLRCIGSTTPEEYRKHFEKDRALVRRFRKITIGEPSVAESKLILRGLRGLYEAYHQISYTEAALDAAVDLTHRHVHAAWLPDKAIDIIDQAGARQRISPPDERLTLIDVAAIEAEVAQLAVLPVQVMAEPDSAKLGRLHTDLAAVVFGQSQALTALTDAVMITRAGLREPHLPAGSYLFTGSTGVGKSEVARQLARTLGLPLIKFDMSEYMEKHAVSKLIGAPPGYVGFGDGAAGDGLLVNAIDTSPACVLLLDEIEKAHEDLFNILLQVMDDATLTNAQGKTVRFDDVILIMTTNAGVAATEHAAIGFGRRDEAGEIDDKAIKRLFKPEFRNRLDAIIGFNRLAPAVMIRIVDKFLAALAVLTERRGVTLDVTQPARLWLAAKGYDPVFGARPLRRLIADSLKRPLSRLMLFGALQAGGTVRVEIADDRPSLTVLPSQPMSEPALAALQADVLL